MHGRQSALHLLGDLGEGTHQLVALSPTLGGLVVAGVAEIPPEPALAECRGISNGLRYELDIVEGVGCEGHDEFLSQWWLMNAWVNLLTTSVSQELVRACTNGLSWMLLVPSLIWWSRAPAASSATTSVRRGSV